MLRMCPAPTITPMTRLRVPGYFTTPRTPREYPCLTVVAWVSSISAEFDFTAVAFQRWLVGSKEFVKVCRWRDAVDVEWKSRFKS